MAKKILSVCLAAVFVFTNLELGFAQIPDVAQIMKEIEGRRKTNGDKAEPEPEEVVYKKFQCPSCDREFEIGVDPNDLELKRGTKKIVCPYDGAEFYPKDFVEEEEELQYETVRCPSCGRDFKAYIDVKGILAGRPQMLICPYDKNKFYFKAEGFKPGPLLRANLATVICPNTRRTFKAYIDPENPRELVSPYDGTRFYPTPDLIVPEKFMAGNGLLDAASGLSKGAQQSLVMPENRSVFPRHTPIEDAQSRIERMFSEHIPFTVSKYISQFGYDIFKPSQPIMGEGLQQGKEGFEKDTAPESKFLKSLFGSRQQESIFGEKDAALEGGPSAFISPTEVPEIRDYVLGPGDDLKITIWGQVQQIFTVKVDPEGKVLLPKIGPLYLWGLKFSEAEKKIKDSLLSAYTNIQVEVSIGKLRAIKVFVLGEAEKPGAHTISALSNIFHAIYAAGGPTKMGSMRKIRLRREGKPEMPVDLYNILLKGDSSQDYKLQGDDVLFIPPIGDVIGIAGNVKRPAIYEMSDKMRLSDLINMAGGLSSVGSLQRIQLERVKDHQKKVVLDLEFKSIADLENSEDNVTMQDGDLALIFPIVPIRYNFVSITGNVLMPGDYELKGEMRLKDLMDKAGGILPGTYLNRAEIARFKGGPDQRDYSGGPCGPYFG
ncbi:MAG: SLBB domain-containing protein [Candidatus Omnitrophota bacterium]